MASASEHESTTPSSALRASVEGQRRRRRTLLGVLAGVAAVALVVVGIVIGTSQGGDDAEAAPGDERLALTLAVSEDNDYYSVITEVAAEEGLDLTWKNLSDWVLPNTELVAGSVDGNAFQHNLFLSTFNAENDADLVPVFSTQIVQWGIFSAKHDSLDQIADGGAIAIPDDPSNGGRALLILQTAELITLDPDAGLTPTIDDVVENPKDLSFSEIGATTIPQQFDDPSLDAVVVGSHHFDPSQGVDVEDALYAFQPEGDAAVPFINVVATRSDRLDDPAWEILEAAYGDPRVLETVEEEFRGTHVPAEVPGDDLRDGLASLQAAAEAAGS